MSIILYDIPSTYKENTFSPNTWKARFALNYRGIPFKVEWVEFPDIEPLSKKLGIAPTGTKVDGSGPYYSLPAIYDPSTGTYVSDSIQIAEYLEKTYPDDNIPSLFPNNTLPLHAAFGAAFERIITPLYSFGIPLTCYNLNPVSAAYYRQTREKWYATTMEEMLPSGERAAAEWAKVQAAWDEVAGWYAKNESDKGLFLLGELPSWADFVVVSYIVWMRTLFGGNSQQWKDLSTWNGGRWKKLLDALDRYVVVD